MRTLRARAQRLEVPLHDAAAVVREIVAVQAQDTIAAALSIRARTVGVDREAVRRALEEQRSIVRIWAMRGTLHVVAAEDAAWLNDLFAAGTLRGTHRRLGQLGVPEADRPRAVTVIRAALADHGPLTRPELMEHVARVGIETAGQAAAHLTALAALEGHVCFGPECDGKPAFVLRDDWLGPDLPRLERDEALRELARRYARGYAPASADDFAAWSGLTLRDARAGCTAVDPHVAHGDAPDPPVVRLLPAFDTYLLGYRTRDLAVPREHASRVWPGGGIIRPTVVANGLVVGTWARARDGVAVEPFSQAPPGCDREIEAVERFLRCPARARSSPG